MTIEQFKTDEVILSNINQDTIPRQVVMQGEKDGRSLTVQVTNGGVVEPQAGLNLSLGWKHRTAKDKEGNLIQGLDAFTPINRETGLFRIEYTSSMAQPGTIDAEIQFVTSISVTKSQPFIITVKQSMVDENAVESESSFTVLQEALTKVSKYDEKIDELAFNKADKKEIEKVEELVSKMPSATPKETFNTLGELNTKFPNGDTSAMVVLEADGETGFVYLWSGSEWKKGALYQARGLAEKSVDRAKLASEVENGTDLMVISRNEGDFYNKENQMSYPGGTGGSDQVTFTVDEIESGKRYRIDATENFPGPTKPSFILEGRVSNLNGSCTIQFDYDITSQCLLVLEPYNAAGTKLPTVYKAIQVNQTRFDIFLEVEGMTQIALRQLAFNVNVSGKQHAHFWNFNVYAGSEEPSNLKTRLESLQTNVLKLEEDVSKLDSTKVSSIVIDYDYFPVDFNIALTLDEYGFPFKFNAGTKDTNNSLLIESLIRRGCEASAYFNDSQFLPTDADLESNQEKTDSYVAEAVRRQQEQGISNQVIWSNRQFKTGSALKASLKKYGFRFERMRNSTMFLPEKITTNEVTTVYVSDNNTNWYQHTLDLIDSAVRQQKSCAVFTHLLYPGEGSDGSGINTCEKTWRLILDKIKGYVDAGKAEVITYADYFEKLKREK